MGFKEAIRTVYRDKFFTFSGRASRSEYWYTMLFLLLISIALFAMVFVVIGLPSSSSTFESGPPVAGMIMIGLASLAYLVAIIPTIALTIRRLHDRNMSGWWYLGFFVLGMVPYVGFLATIAMLVITILKGTDGENRFGPDPLKGAADAGVFA